MVGQLYLEHLSDTDLRFLSSFTQSRRLRDEPETLVQALDSSAVFRAVFTQPGDDPLFRVSPFLLFSLLVHRAARDLAEARFIEEWVGPRQRVPVFDVDPVQEFAGDPVRRFFLAELLASYTNVSSGSVLVQTRRGWRRRRFSELDPLRLIELAEVLPVGERPSVYRRLGDLSLFLTGIFPDYAAERLVMSRERRQLERALQPADREHSEPRDGVWLLERIGMRAYRIAHRAADRRTALTDVLETVSDNFAAARRVLNFVTDRYLFPLRQRWFGIG